MSDKFHPIPLKLLHQLILNEYNTKNSIFGIPDELFFDPGKNKHLRTELFRQKLDTPIGVAAGPHSQMAQNIVGAWLMGARYIELKTIQTLDEIEVSKPCIDMQDEGYNCEWSQELKISESFNEYLNGWIIIHLLHLLFGWKGNTGTIFNMSVGYNMQGILNENVQWFLGKMNDCSEELAEKVKEIIQIYPRANEIMIPSRISDNITLSTMHGCPADEIEQIADYLINKCKLFTFVKLNPTLLGPDLLRDILNNKLIFKTKVPDIAFDHDLKYNDAVKIIKSLQKTAKENNLEFGLKLTNTLESINNKDIFRKDTEMMYMSGRALHPISVNLANKLQNDFSGELLMSFSAGADAFNISDTLSCGFKTVTVCSDLLKPGGYMRLKQYFEKLNESMKASNSETITSFIINSSDKSNSKEAALSNLGKYSEAVLKSDYYKREYLKIPDIKGNRGLDYFDCISAPCCEACGTNQDIPDYMHFTSAGLFNEAYKVILNTNPFPATTGMVCDHLCQLKCTRINYDEALQIRDVKRFISEQDKPVIKPGKPNGLKVAVIGAGPAGLSCGFYLALSGFSVDVFESNSKAGGMARYAIPGFRLTDKAIGEDIGRITGTGVRIQYNTRVDGRKFDLLKKDFNYIFIGAGAQLSANFELEGIEAKGVIDPLHFLFNVKAGKKHRLGKNVVIIGGGNTAMDSARTALRLVGKNGKVTVIYRRTINEMPADNGEIKSVIKEGMEIIELTSPEKIIQENGMVKGLICSKMELKGLDNKGRPKPVKVEGSEFEIECDTVIPAVGQLTDIDFVQPELLTTDTGNYLTRIENVFIGGDSLRGASTAINAIGDGRKAAEQIIKASGTDAGNQELVIEKKVTKKDLMIARSKREFAHTHSELPFEKHPDFRLVTMTPDELSVIKEAGRCLYCDEICNICMTVCPNFANFSFDIEPVKYNLQKAVALENGGVQIVNDKIFEIKQKYQILNIKNFCNECGNCATFCPTNSSPNKEKPAFYLTILSFNEAEEGYYFARVKDKKNLIFRQKENIETLTEFPDAYLFETDFVLARFSKNDFKILDVKFKTPCVKEAQFKHAAEMSILIKGAENLV